MNPCPCGFYPDRNKCNCTISQVKRYLSKISRPLLDRIDICVETMTVNYEELKNKKVEESSLDIRTRVLAARKIQLERYDKEGIYYNSQLTPKLIEKYCVLKSKEEELLKQAYIKYNLSARAYHRILKVSRTIADLEESEDISVKHISEAIYYRSIDKKYWGEE